ncbi:MAG TPA: hypothetical protein VLA37_08860 [Sphingomonadaceae bacterium]|nr:hypothetical protein [Sphingomonadaceae bacterium]
MNMQTVEMPRRASPSSGLSSEDIRELRQATWQDGHVGRVEADTLLLANDDLRGSSQEWSDFFVEALFEHVVNSREPRGSVDEAGTRWLWSRISVDGTAAGMEELELMARILQRADPVADSFKEHALGIIEKAVTQGIGPTRAGKLIGKEIPIGCISDKELQFLRRMIYRSERNIPRKVGRIEAEALYRIKEATKDGENSKDWPALFVQGVGAYLQSFGGNEPLTSKQEAELAEFLQSDGANLGGFLQRMFEAQAGGSVREYLKTANDIDPLERALLEFLAV